MYNVPMPGLEPGLPEPQSGGLAAIVHQHILKAFLILTINHTIEYVV